MLTGADGAVPVHDKNDNDSRFPLRDLNNETLNQRKGPPPPTTTMTRTRLLKAVPAYSHARSENKGASQCHAQGCGGGLSAFMTMRK